ncbi:MAG: SDR family NAD(P)-dependent oxidoreductase [Chlorobiales bacterium]|nr:SDR family NAD(P)-dependent oxidoreductase [Chlorobiales bacterium]
MLRKKVIITGASGNLGMAVTAKFLAEGYAVIATVEPGKDEEKALLYSLTDTAEALEVHVVDVLKEAAAEKFIADMIEKHEQIDAAVMTVGGFRMGEIGTTDEKALDRMISLNFKTAYFTAKPLFEHMKGQVEGGRLVFIGARPGFDVRIGTSSVAYALSKSLIFRLAEIINAEGQGKNVVASVIAPSIIDTPQNRESMPDANFSDWVKPEEIADAILFACSEHASKLREPVFKVYGRS